MTDNEQKALAIQQLVDAVNRGEKIEITTYPPLPAVLFPNEEPGVTQSTAYITVEACTPEEIERADSDVSYGNRWEERSDCLIRALRANRKAMQNSGVIT
jgi:hypothetical protein